MDRNQWDKYNHLGLNISYYRKMRGYTQMQLAEQIGIERTHMGNIEQATAGASLDVIFRLSDVLDVPVYKFFVFRD